MARNPFNSLRSVVTALVGVAAVLVSIAAVVYIVDTVRGNDGNDGATLRRDVSDNAANEDNDLPFDGLLARVGGTLLGVSVEETDGGLVVRDVVPDSPADQAGIAKGDVISAVDGEAIATVAELRRAIAAIDPGEQYDLTISTDDDKRTVAVTRPQTDAFQRFAITAPGPLLGVTAEDSDNGVVVVSVLPGLGAEDAGIAEGDVIRAVDGTPVATVADLRNLLADRAADDTVTVDLERADEQFQVSVALSDAPPVGAQGGGFRLLPGGDRSPGRSGAGQGLTPQQLDQYGALLEGLQPELRARLERIIQQLLENGYPPPAPQPGQRVPAGA